VGHLTHDRTPGGAALTCHACALGLLRCSSGDRCGREEREGRNPFSPPPSATRRRCRARGQPLRSCKWFACSLPCQYGKGDQFVRVPEKKRKTIPVLTPRARYANRMSRYIRLQTSRRYLLVMRGGPTVDSWSFLRVSDKGGRTSACHAAGDIHHCENLFNTTGSSVEFHA
jgi:hypothetical protein